MCSYCWEKEYFEHYFGKTPCIIKYFNVINSYLKHKHIHRDPNVVHYTSTTSKLEWKFINNGTLPPMKIYKQRDITANFLSNVYLKQGNGLVYGIVCSFQWACCKKHKTSVEYKMKFLAHTRIWTRYLPLTKQMRYRLSQVLLTSNNLKVWGLVVAVSHFEWRYCGVAPWRELTSKVSWQSVWFGIQADFKNLKFN